MTRPLGEASIETVALRPGYRISRLVKGGWQLAGDHGPVEFERAVADMTAFVDAGIATFDCADIYTGVEEMIGTFLARLAGARGAACAAAVKVHTKYVPDLATLDRLDRAAVARVIDRSLARLGRERLDLVQFHWWDYAVPGAAACARHLAGLQAEGKIDRIGVSATRQGWSRGNGVCDDPMKPCLSSSGCETRPAKGEPARPVASLAPETVTDSAKRRHASEWAVGR